MEICFLKSLNTFSSLLPTSNSFIIIYFFLQEEKKKDLKRKRLLNPNMYFLPGNLEGGYDRNIYNQGKGISQAC